MIRASLVHMCVVSNSQNLSSKAGLTLVEVVVAISLLAIGLAGSYYGVNMAMQARKFSHDSYVGTLIANNRIEFAKNQPYSQLVNLGESNKKVDEYGNDDSDGRYSRTTTISTLWGGNSNATAITVSVKIPHPRLSDGSGGTATVSTILRRE